MDIDWYLDRMQHNGTLELKRAEHCPPVRRTRNAFPAEHDR